MLKQTLLPFAVLLLTSSSISLPSPKEAVASTAGYFSDFTIVPYEYKKAYSIQVKYTLWGVGAHRLTCGWNSESSSFSNGNASYSYFPINNQTVSGSAGDTFTFDYYVPYKYVTYNNEMTFIDYDILENVSSYKSITPYLKENYDERDLGTNRKISGNTYIDVDALGNFVERQEEAEIINYKAAIQTDSRGILPLDRFKCDFYNVNGHKSINEEDSNLTLSISGDSFMDFDPLLGHGGSLSTDGKSIEVPLKWKKDGDGYLYPILSETVFGYDFGKGSLPYSETLDMPSSKEKYPVYHCRISNYSDELGWYYYEFDVEKGEDYFGSCRNSSWCVGVS